jgi:hypothetical protein
MTKAENAGPKDEKPTRRNPLKPYMYRGKENNKKKLIIEV